MIAAGLLPACAAAWHRGVLEMVRAGWWQDLPWADRWPPVVWLAAPAALVTAVAVGAAATSRPALLIVALGLSGVVHPWLAVVLAPLALLVRAWPSPADLRMPALVGGLAWLSGVWMTPPCQSSIGGALLAADLAGAWWPAIGLAGAVLISIDLLFNHAGRRAQMASLAVLLLSGGWLLSGRVTDVTALLGASTAVWWWRIAAGAGHVLTWQTTVVGRLGAGALVALVPVLAVERAGTSAQAAEVPASLEVWSVLETAGSPAAVMTAGGRTDVATIIWRSGRAEAQRALVVIPPDPEVTSRYLATTAVYAWRDTARTLAMRGMLVAPVPMRDQPQPLLWRVLQFERCATLTPDWVDVGPATAGGQFAGLFPIVEPNRGVLVYLASPRALAPQALDWPPESVQGLDARMFDRQSPTGLAAMTEALGRDGLAAPSLGNARFVTRLRLDRRGTAPETLGISLGGLTTAAWARVYIPGDARPDRQPSICRSSVGQPITAYAGAPATLAFDLSSPHIVGGGWHGPERSGEEIFRWTAEPEADLLFIAHRPQPLVLGLDAQPGTGDWVTADLQVRLNDEALACREGRPPCAWVLPPEAMRTGLNVITLHSVTVPAPAPETRRLGLLVRGVQLARP